MSQNEKPDLLPLTEEFRSLEELLEVWRERERDYHDLADRMVYEGNSVSWWHSKATAYSAALRDAWKELNAAGIRANGEKDVAAGIRELAIKLSAYQSKG